MTQSGNTLNPWNIRKPPQLHIAKPMNKTLVDFIALPLSWRALHLEILTAIDRPRPVDHRVAIGGPEHAKVPQIMDSASFGANLRGSTLRAEIDAG
jgi:hypothetical protein